MVESPAVPWSVPPLAQPAALVDDHAPEWRVHDRTHLELALPFPVAREHKRLKASWEAYFFAPESFRLDAATYAKEEIYADFQSYVRLMVHGDDVGALSGGAVRRLSDRLEQLSPEQATRAIRLVGCRIRRSCVKAVRRIEEQLAERPGPSLAAVDAWLEGVRDVTEHLRELMEDYGGTGPVAEALRWIDEDASLLVESLMGQLAGALDRHMPGEPRIEMLVARAVSEARYRRAVGYDSVIAAELDAKEIERLEFRRHMLKRFAASALWLQTEVYTPGTWVEHVMFGVAASLAMAFAVIAALWNGHPAQEQLPLWLAVAIAAYAVKDRMKAALQDRFRRIIRRYTPDRRWRVLDQQGVEIGHIDEACRFAAFTKLPPAVLAERRRTRRHPIEEEARPETVLWHRKEIDVDAARIDGSYDGVLEVFRLDLSRWLTHTDDPKNHIVLAEPDRGELAAIVAPRVYNIAVVYRVNTHGGEGRWHRIRVVVSRKGIKRIDPIT